MTPAEIEQTISDYVRCALLAREAGFDGVEIMGSEGYLINEFTVLRTNDRSDEWGGSAENRHRLPVELVQAGARGDGSGFHHHLPDIRDRSGRGRRYRRRDRSLARKVEAAGADILNTGIGWHEARVPTIAYPIPRGAWRFAAARLKRVVGIPVVASNRINTPDACRGNSRGWRQRSGLDGAPDAGRSAFRQEGAGRQCRRDQCLHRLQSGLPRSDLFRSQRHLPRQSARLPRDRVRRGAGGEAAQGRGGRRRARAVLRPQPRRAVAATGSRCSKPPIVSAARSILRARFPARPNSTRCCATSAGRIDERRRRVCGSTHRRPRRDLGKRRV